MSASDVALKGLAGLLVALAVGSAFGQAANTREQEQIRRLRQQVQQLQAEQAAQQQQAQRAGAEKAQAEAKLDAAAQQLRRTQIQVGAQARTAEQARKEMEALQQERNALQAAADALKAELQEAGRSLATLRSEHTRLQNRLALRDDGFADLERRHATQAQGLQQCVANNQALHALGKELLQRWVDKGVLETAAQVEPLFQLRRVELENLVQGYDHKLDRQALKAGASGDLRAP